jgi:UDP-N-acetylmuramoyl-L-alanyl-D-glutamate--2,6-diaminopimelate ligase
MELNELFGARIAGLAAKPAAVTSITSDSRSVRPGTVFVAVKGTSQDGHEFIAQAEAAGAIAIVGEDPAPKGLNIPYLRVASSRLELARLAAVFHGHPSHAMLMVGITGTSGKTTTSYLVESILRAAGHKVGVIGTVSYRIGDEILPSTHTTPGAAELQELFARMRDRGCTAVSMEVSSHALKMHRAAFTAFDGMVFSNLSREHLDFHPDMEDYYASKRILFTDMVAPSVAAGKTPFAAVNGEDDYGRRLLVDLPSGLAHAAFRVPRTLKIDLQGVHGVWEGVKIESALMGRFNASNILAAASVCRGMRIPLPAIEEGIRNLKAVPGRMERVPNSRGINVLVDYAHKPDALDNVLRTLEEVRGTHRIITVFGCGGDRDRTKRPVMGKMAAERSQLVYVTSDNPRTEDPLSIIREIEAGTDGFGHVRTEPDRRKAIVAAIEAARPGDIVLIAGKGHEDYQILGRTKVHFDDREVAAEALTGRSAGRPPA